jgi:hypothetical protein
MTTLIKTGGYIHVNIIIGISGRSVAAKHAETVVRLCHLSLPEPFLTDVGHKFLRNRVFRNVFIYQRSNPAYLLA